MAMATPTTPTTATEETAAKVKKLPSNPTPLSAPQEQQVRDLYYKNVRAKCAKEIEAFAACARGRTISTTWRCRPEKLSMNTCMLRYQGQEELDKARAEWFALAGERKREREERKRKEEEARRKHKEWWALDEHGKLQGKRAEVDERLESKR